jgi:hypothetical protein
MGKSMEGEELFRSKTDPFLEQTFRSSVACLNQKLKNSRFPTECAICTFKREEFGTDRAIHIYKVSIYSFVSPSSNTGSIKDGPY